MMQVCSKTKAEISAKHEEFYEFEIKLSWRMTWTTHTHVIDKWELGKVKPV